MHNRKSVPASASVTRLRVTVTACPWTMTGDNRSPWKTSVNSRRAGRPGAPFVLAGRSLRARALRGSSDQKQVAQLKATAYASLVDELVARAS